MRVLVSGDRNWADFRIVWTILDGIAWSNPDLVVIDGKAKGADTAAGEWRAESVRQHERYPALWDEHGRAAGPIRNRQMLTDGKPDVVVAFHDDLANSKGTKDMVTAAKEAGVPVYVVSHG